MASCCTTRINASAADIARTPARSAHPSFPNRGCSITAEKWTSVLFAQAVRKYGRNRIAEGKLPACAEQCATKALLGGDAAQIGEIYRERVNTRGYGPELWGWDIAYNRGKK